MSGDLRLRRCRMSRGTLSECRAREADAMSFWFRRKSKRGVVHYYSVSIPFTPLIILLALIATLCLNLLRWLLGPG